MTPGGGRLSGAINLSSVFSFFERHLQRPDDAVMNCIEVRLVENLFWDVPPGSASGARESMPQSLKHLYLSFHGRPPTTG